MDSDWKKNQKKISGKNVQMVLLKHKGKECNVI